MTNNLFISINDIIQNRYNRLLHDLDYNIQWFNDENEWESLKEMMQEPFARRNDHYKEIRTCAEDIIYMSDEILNIISIKPQLNDDKSFIPFLKETNNQFKEWIS